MKTKILLLPLLLIFSTGHITAQNGTEQYKKYKNEITLRLPLLNGYYRSFYQTDKISLGLGIEAGLLGGANIPLIHNEKSSGTLYDYDLASLRMEFFKVMPFLKYYYNKSNYLSVGPYYAVALGQYDGASTEFNFYGTTGINMSVFYGWDVVKFGVGIQAGTLTSGFSGKNQSFFIEVEPLIISVLF